MMRKLAWGIGTTIVVSLLIAAIVQHGAIGADKQKAEKEKKTEKQPTKQEESERSVKASEVPKAAMQTLKKLAAGAEITEFAEEVEHGSTFYEGSWINKAGAKTDVLVTAAGDLVEIEESVEVDQVPKATLAAARKAAGPDNPLRFEKKTVVLYEVKFRKDERGHELLLTPDGRHVEEQVQKGKGAKEEEDEEADDDEEKTERKRQARGREEDDDEKVERKRGQNREEKDDDEDEDEGGKAKGREKKEKGKERRDRDD
jgi:hypothetical protein